MSVQLFLLLLQIAQMFMFCTMNFCSLQQLVHHMVASLNTVCYRISVILKESF